METENFPIIDKKSWFYENCKRQRKAGAKICQCCPFRLGIEKQEFTPKRECFSPKSKDGKHRPISNDPEGIYCGLCGLYIEYSE